MTSPKLRRYLRVFAATACLLATATPALASDVTGKAGLDTSLPATASAVAVSGRGPFADLKITVNQTKDLLNQAISVNWTGGAPTISGPNRFAANYVQLMQCWGDDDGTHPDNPGPPASQCVAGATFATISGANNSLFPPGTFAPERIISRKDFANFNEADGVYDDKSRFLWQPFKAVDGTVVGVHKNPAFRPDIVGGVYWEDPYFNIVTTNEIATGRTGGDGTGAELMEVTTGAESSGLGCGMKVQPTSDGGTKIPKCWLVVVPRGTPSYENEGTPFEDGADRYGVMTSPLAPHAWQSRISIPLDFVPVQSSCSLASDQRRLVGTELLTPAVTSWQPKLCANPDLSPFAYASVADSSARQQLVNPVTGGPGMVVVSRPVSPDLLDPDSPIVYAPLTASGIVIGFNVERNPKPSADSAARAVAGRRIAQLNLSPRLVAKLLTQSYRQQVEIEGSSPGYDWDAKNPTSLIDDPDFLQFNPEFAELQVFAGKNFSGLITPAGNSDVARAVWEYVLADPEARSWLDGNPDPFGMKVNPVYATVVAKNSTGTAFADPVPENFPKADPYCYQSANTGLQGEVKPPLLCGTDWLPYTNTMREAAHETRAADDAAKVVLQLAVDRPDQAWGRDIPQISGLRSILSLTDSASAFQFGIQTARLSRAGDDGTARKFIAADAGGLTAGLAGMKPGADLGVSEPDPKADAPGGYPLTALSYAAIKPLALDAPARKEYAAFIDYAAGDGQVSGPLLGQLPQGYAPLSPALVTQARGAADKVRTLTATQAVTDDSGSGDTGSGAMSTPSSSSSSFGSGSASRTDPATLASPALAASSSSSTAVKAKRLFTPAIAVPGTRFAVIGLVAIVIAAGAGAANVGRRRRAAVS